MMSGLLSATALNQKFHSLSVSFHFCLCNMMIDDDSPKRLSARNDDGAQPPFHFRHQIVLEKKAENDRVERKIGNEEICLWRLRKCCLQLRERATTIFHNSHFSLKRSVFLSAKSRLELLVWLCRRRARLFHLFSFLPFNSQCKEKTNNNKKESSCSRSSVRKRKKSPKRGSRGQLLSVLAERVHANISLLFRLASSNNFLQFILSVFRVFQELMSQCAGRVTTMPSRRGLMNSSSSMSPTRTSRSVIVLW